MRYPLDISVSLWSQERYQAGRKVAEPDEFLEDPVFGLDKCLRFYQIWEQGHADVDSFHVVKYEAMRDHPYDSFSALLHFLEIPIKPEQLNAAVDFASFDNMKALEASGAAPKYPSSGLNIFGPGSRRNPDAFHVRKGKVGGYREYLSANLTAYFEVRVRLEMPWYEDAASHGDSPSHV